MGAAAPTRPGPPAGGTGSIARSAVGTYGAPTRDRMAAPSGWGQLVEGTGSLAQAAVGAHGAHAVHGSLQRPGPTSWWDRESHLDVGRRLWSACGGRLPVSVRALRLGCRVVQPTRWSVPAEVCEGQQPPSAQAH